jgi:predicted MFS family arabinose efflux permease
VYLSLAHGTSPEVVGLLIALYAAGAVVSASQAHRLVRWRDPVQVVVVGFALEGVAALGIPVLASDALIGAAMFVYGLGNGLISPMQKSLITRNAPAEVRAGVVSLDRMLQQVAKTLGSGAMGVLVLWADVGTVFWVLGSLSLLSVGMAAVLLTRWGASVAPRPISAS